MTPVELDAIIAAVGIQPDDRRLLSEDLAESYASYMHLKDRERQAKRPTLKAIRKAAEELARMVTDHPRVEQSIEDDANKLCQRLRELEKETKPRLGRRYSLTEAFVGFLSHTFEQRFGEEAMVTRGGRFVRFAVAVCETYQVKADQDLIIKALALFKSDDEIFDELE